MDLTPKSSNELMVPERIFTTSIAPIVRKSPSVKRDWTFTGTVRSVLSGPSLFDVGDIVASNGIGAKTSVEIEFHHALSAVTVNHDKSLAAAAISPITGDGKRFRIEIDVPPDNGAPRAVQYDLQLNATVATAVDPISVALTLRGRIAKDVYVMPESVAFGVVAMGCTVRQQLRIRSRTSKAFQVVAETGGFADASLLELDGDAQIAEHSPILSVFARQPGFAHGTTWLSIRQNGCPEYRLPVHVSYNGTHSESSPHRSSGPSTDSGGQ